MANELLWQTKLAARLHDPAEKALVLLRDPEGHENGTCRALKRLLGLDQLASHIDPDNDEVLARVVFKKALPLDIYRHVQRADWWAAAADRPQWPMQQIQITTNTGQQKTLAVAPWARVNWADQPVLIHPLTGTQFDLSKRGGLTGTDLHDIKRRSFEHFAELLRRLGAGEDDAPEWRKVLLACWRFGPDLSVTQADTADNGRLGALWELLPADTRVPDHSIWDHLDLTSAFAGAFAADPQGEAALLALSIGPVQGFIAAARKTDDLWAGSHLLSRLAWETMRPICEALGPDAILFPRLRGIPQVDLWLRDRMALPEQLFERCEWNQGGTDANPLFSAALPNRFVALVPACRARELAEACRAAVRAWLLDRGFETVDRLLEAAGLRQETDPRDESVAAYAQMREQLADFPEVHWAVVPFSLIQPRNRETQTDLDLATLSAAMAPFFGVEPGTPCGFLATPAWQVLQKAIEWSDGTTFFAPNPGVLYPAVYDLAERVLAAAKAARPFAQSAQTGWRCSLTGEAEWLTTDRTQLAIPPGSRKDTLWTRVADRKPAWARKGEHLAALPAIKRLWPTIFGDEVSKALNRPMDRFVVSTHTMALAHQLDQWLKKKKEEEKAMDGGPAMADPDLTGADSVALPRGLVRKHWSNPALADARRIPGLLEAARDSEDDAVLARAQQRIRQTLGAALGKDEVLLETYYALLLMDGDHMGAILSGDETIRAAIPYRDSFHPRVQAGFDEAAARQRRIKDYGAQRRAISPNRHLAISGALNDFSQTVVRHVVEHEHLGRLIYAGGDDVLAMLPVADLLSAMARLRDAYSGHDPAHDGGLQQGLTLHQGFAALRSGDSLRVMRMMGAHVTASCGAVVAHHQAPLSTVMRELRVAERRAKDGGRNAFSITVLKRSGGALHLTAQWGEPLLVLSGLIAYLRDEDTSRRAVYHSLEWLRDLPDPRQNEEMLERMLGYQLARQAKGQARDSAPRLANRLAAMAAGQKTEAPLKWLQNFLAVAEFLARETRSKGDA